jgi:mannose-1-phosphate guanylyltransferase
MAGGLGSRFWPLSLPHQPKQFLTIPPITGASSLLQLTVERIKPLIPVERIWVVGLEEHRQLLSEQLGNIPSSNIIYEPFGKNTAATVAVAAKILNKIDAKAKMLVLPADHYIADADPWLNAVQAGADLLENMSRLVTFGITPRWAETGYGYIERGKKQLGNIYQVDSFREKPEKAKAKEYIESAKFLWNSGMFLWHADTVLAEFSKYCLEIAKPLAEHPIVAGDQDGIKLSSELYHALPKISVDCAIMEKTKLANVIETDIQWSDLGGWDAVYELLGKDKEGNAIVAKARALNEVSNCLLHCPDIEVIANGINDLVVVFEKGRLLITKRPAPASQMRELVEKILNNVGKKL